MPDLVSETILVLGPPAELLRRVVSVAVPADFARLGADSDDPAAGWQRLLLDRARSEVVANRVRKDRLRTSEEVVGIVPGAGVDDAWAVWRRRGVRGAVHFVRAVDGDRVEARRAALEEIRRAMPRRVQRDSRVAAGREVLEELVELGVDVGVAVAAEGCRGGREDLRNAARLRTPGSDLPDGELLLIEVVAVAVASVLLRTSALARP